MSRFKSATRQQAKLRMAFDGPSGSGKTYSALRVAWLLALKGKSRVAVIDTEHGSASKYVGERPDGSPWQFDVLELVGKAGGYAPSEYTAAINEAGREGYDVLVIDSLSHAWIGEGGALDLKDKQGGNSFTAWQKITPMQRTMVDTILAAPLHVIATMRSKTEYVLEKDERTGKMTPRKIGMAPLQRDGMEYEFDVYGSLDYSHILTISKSRCSAVQDLILPKPGTALVEPLWQWLTTGAEPAPAPKPTPAEPGTQAANGFHEPNPAVDELALSLLSSRAGEIGDEFPRLMALIGVESMHETPANLFDIVYLAIDKWGDFDPSKLLAHYGVSSLSAMTPEQIASANRVLQTKRSRVKQ